ncbi:C-type lectin lectoxin-Phi1 [Dissostichus eleginoides]|uniref:C-type lectin lectoxin-Phi1 n=1 Tax=Dissostichus eleginoides TaxID=100907 RepID=A0AAD9C751_DISEL|nr:C-type lectin lectoxin-Phi1 [Dissostichus eleginoides]
MDETLMVILLLSGFCAPCTPFRNDYLFINKNMTWDEAYQYCLMEQKELAQIQSLENNTSMMNTQTAGYTYKAWIGLYANASDWTWVDGETATYFEWGNVQPDNIDTDEYCVTIDNDGRWGFANCSLKKPFVCQDGN